MNDDPLFSDPLARAAWRGDIIHIRALLAQGPDSTLDRSSALSLAAEMGHAECVNALIPGSDSAALSQALQAAALAGRHDCLQALIEAPNPLPPRHALPGELAPWERPKDARSLALRKAAREGHARCVELLIPVSNPNAQRWSPLILAAQRGRDRCVELLLPATDLSADSEGETVGALAARLARQSGRLLLAERIRAEMEARELSASAAPAPSPSRPKPSL